MAFRLYVLVPETDSLGSLSQLYCLFSVSIGKTCNLSEPPFLICKMMVIVLLHRIVERINSSNRRKTFRTAAGA